MLFLFQTTLDEKILKIYGISLEVLSALLVVTFSGGITFFEDSWCYPKLHGDFLHIKSK